MVPIWSEIGGYALVVAALAALYAGQEIGRGLIVRARRNATTRAHRRHAAATQAPTTHTGAAA